MVERSFVNFIKKQVRDHPVLATAGGIALGGLGVLGVGEWRQQGFISDTDVQATNEQVNFSEAAKSVLDAGDELVDTACLLCKIDDLQATLMRRMANGRIFADARGTFHNQKWRRSSSKVAFPFVGLFFPQGCQRFAVGQQTFFQFGQ